jgi:methionine biosynthesis protein MetW
MKTKRYCIPDPAVAVTDRVIMDQVDSGSRVIDLGCGDGRLLAKLGDEHGCWVMGIEVDVEAIHGAIGRGVPVIHADLDHGLPDVPDDSFDVAVLSQTLQQVRLPRAVLKEMMRVARRALVVVPNFGNWKVRRQIMLQGRAPVTKALPYEWYDTPNLHFITMHDFRDLAELLGLRIVRELPIINGRAVDRAWAANLRADSALYVLERPTAGERGQVRV